MVLLPLLALSLVFCDLLERSSPPTADTGREWGALWIQSVTLVGGALALGTEGLSLVHALKPAGVAVFWGVIDAFLVVRLVPRLSSLRRRFAESSARGSGWSRWEKAIVAGLAGLVLLLLVTALLSQPNTVDSLLYHMPRVRHWAQNGSLAPYPTQYGNQIWLPPFAEEVILHLSLLTGSEGPAPLVQWFSFVSLLIISAVLTKTLGGERRVQLTAMAFFASIPMAVLQATSTQNDLVAAHWLLALAYFVVLADRRSLTLLETICLGMAAGLGLLTKATMYVYAAPLLLWYGAGVWKAKRGQGILSLAAAALTAAILNAGYWARNLATSGGLFGPVSLVQETTRAFDLPRALTNLPAAIVRTVAVHLASPSEALNDRIVAVVTRLAGSPGLTGPAFSLEWRWNHEDFATAPLHLAVAVVAGAIFMFRFRSQRGRLMYGVSLFAAAGLLAGFLTLSGHPQGVRFHLPLLALAAPVVAGGLEAFLSRRAAMLVPAGMVLLALPYVFFNTARPLIGMTPQPEGLELPCLSGCTAIGSLLEAAPMDVLFANLREYQPSYTQAAKAASDLECNRVGMRLDSHDPEYLFWRLLRPGPEWRIESVYSLDELRYLVDPSFRPCAILCTICGGREYLHGLPLLTRAEAVGVYSGPGFVLDPDAAP